MKKYEKPTLTMFSLVGNETICGGCGEKLSQNTDLNEFIADLLWDDDGILTKDEASNVFGIEKGCSIQINGYCKFTGTAQSVAWS